MYRPTRQRALLLTLLTAVIYVVAVEWLCGWRPLAHAWTQLPVWLILTFLAAMLLSWLIRARRLYDSSDGIPRNGFLATLRLLWLHNAINLLLPARLGEASLPWLLQRRFGLPWRQGSGVLLWLRVLDLHCVATLAIIALAQRLSSPVALAASIIAAVIAALLPFACIASRRWLLRLADSRHPQWRMAPLAIPARPAILLRELALSWLAWIVKLAAFTLVLHDIAAPTFSSAMLGAIGGDASTLLPVHAPGGAGTFEAGVLIGLGSDMAGDALPAAITLHLLLLGTALGAALLSVQELHILSRRHDAVVC